MPFAPMPSDLVRTVEARWTPPSAARIALSSLARLGSSYQSTPLFGMEHVLTLFLFLATQFSRRGSVVSADDATVGYVTWMCWLVVVLPWLWLWPRVWCWGRVVLDDGPRAVRWCLTMVLALRVGAGRGCVQPTGTWWNISPRPRHWCPQSPTSCLHVRLPSFSC